MEREKSCEEAANLPDPSGNPWNGLADPLNG